MLFFRVRQKNPTFFEFKFESAALVQSVALVVFYREFTKLATGVSFFVLVASAVARWGQMHRTLLDCLYPPISVYSECFFGASRNDETTGNNGKRNNNLQA